MERLKIIIRPAIIGHSLTFKNETVNYSEHCILIYLKRGLITVNKQLLVLFFPIQFYITTRLCMSRLSCLHHNLVVYITIELYMDKLTEP